MEFIWSIIVEDPTGSRSNESQFLLQFRKKNIYTDSHLLRFDFTRRVYSCQNQRLLPYNRPDTMKNEHTKNLHYNIEHSANWRPNSDMIIKFWQGKHIFTTFTRKIFSKEGIVNIDSSFINFLRLAAKMCQSRLSLTISKWSRTFIEFRECEKSLKRELGSIEASPQLPVSLWYSGIIRRSTRSSDQPLPLVFR